LSTIQANCTGSIMENFVVVFHRPSKVKVTDFGNHEAYVKDSLASYPVEVTVDSRDWLERNLLESTLTTGITDFTIYTREEYYGDS